MECWEPSQHLLIDTGKPRKTCVEVAGRRTFRILTPSQHEYKGLGLEDADLIHLAENRIGGGLLLTL